MTVPSTGFSLIFYDGAHEMVTGSAKWGKMKEKIHLLCSLFRTSGHLISLDLNC